MKSKILIVDDQPVNIKLLKIKLEREGYEVDSCVDGLKCLEYLENNPNPDLILLDIMMPEMDGIEACKRIKANEKTHFIPIIFITAKAARMSMLEGFEAGGLDYVTKPIDLDETMARIRAQLVREQELAQKYSATAIS